MPVIEIVFNLANMYVLPFWLLMIILPGWTLTKRVVATPLVIVPLGIAYAATLGAGMAGGAELDFSLSGLTALFANPVALTAGWIHYLAFDLFVGRWEYLDNQQHGIHPLIMAPCLLLTFMAGPVGLVMYLAVRWVHIRRTAPEHV